MKTRNATMQENLKRDLKEAHYSGREEVCRNVKSSCEKTANLLHHYRHLLGVIPRT